MMQIRDSNHALFGSKLQISESGFHAWLIRPPSQRERVDAAISGISANQLRGQRPHVWHDVLAEGAACGLHRIERFMRANALRVRPRRRGRPKDKGKRAVASPNLLEHQFVADGPNRKWIADFTCIWTAEGWLYADRRISA